MHADIQPQVWCREGELSHAENSPSYSQKGEKMKMFLTLFLKIDCNFSIQSTVEKKSSFWKWIFVKFPPDTALWQSNFSRNLTNWFLSGFDSSVYIFFKILNEVESKWHISNSKTNLETYKVLNNSPWYENFTGVTKIDFSDNSLIKCNYCVTRK